MVEIIKTWLRSRLGIIVDVSPDSFGRYCRDGTLLAKLLHSYDIINHNQLEIIIQTSDPALARVNLRYLRCWLRFIGVDCNDACIESISNGKGIESLRLFYKVFLCLENKDRLHFITLQKEREKYIPNSTKFDVKVVSEESLIDNLPDHPLAVSLATTSSSLTNWHKKKLQKIIDECKLEREKFRVSQVSKESLEKPILNKWRNPLETDTLKIDKMIELDKFAAQHQVKCPIFSQTEFNMTGIPKLLETNANAFSDPEAAKQFMKTLKNRKSSISTTQNYKVQMQKTLLSNVWEKMERDQERQFDRIIAKKILEQSQYEKQIVTKLCDIRNQKNRIAANRQLVDELIMKTRENELRMMEETAREDKIRENEDIFNEERRMNELHQRITLAKQRRMNQKLYQFAMKTLYDIIDISIKVSEFKRANDNVIPMRIWNEWKILFYKNLPIFELINNHYNYREENENEDEDKNHEQIIDVELLKKNILNECDFENYNNVKSPWDEFEPEIDDKTREYLRLGLIVLGYIVHKLLQIVYAPPTKVIKAPLPDVEVRTVIMGIPDPSFYSSLYELLKHKKIQLFTAEDAINYCLYCYKEEMKDYNYVDINIDNKSNTKLPESLTADNKRQFKEDQREKRKLSKSTTKKVNLLSKMNDENIDKQTQTPKCIPYDDIHPQLSDRAYFGKWAHEILTRGESLPDDFIAKIIVEYLKNFSNIHGWILFNYPNTYQQVRHLEFFFTGNKIPEQLDKIHSNDEIIENNDPSPSRITYSNEDNDFCASCCESEIVPNISSHHETTNMKTYLTAFIRILPKLKNISNKNEEESIQLRSEDTTTVDQFYINEGVASAVYYTTFDISTLKRVAKLAIGSASSSSPRISSMESSKMISNNFENDSTKHNDGNKSILKIPNTKSSLKSIENLSTRKSEVIVEEIGLESNRVKPGEPNWPWADLYLAPEVIENLVILWENMEDVYIDGLKEILALKRLKFSGVILYRDFIIRHINNFISRPDNKQILIHQFQVAFNNIPADMRDDSDVKCELYCQVDDIQGELWDSCDARRRESEEERRRIINDNWTPMEIIILINIYIGLVQLEIDRFIDTVKFIQNYYLKMLKRPTDEVQLDKFRLHKFLLDVDDPNIRDNGAVSSTLHSSIGGNNNNKENPIELPLSLGITESNLKTEVNKILLSDDKLIEFDVTQTSCFKIIQANIDYVRLKVDTVFKSVYDVLNREKNTRSSRRSSDRKGKKHVHKKRISDKSNRSDHKMLETRKLQNLIQEWQYVLLFEVNRIRMRLSLLEASKNSDIQFILSSIQNAFFSIRNLISEKYEKEIKSVNDIREIFCLAIENEISIQEEIILEGDDVFVHPYLLMYPDKVEQQFNSIREKSRDSQFTISQLGRLKDIFQRVAPSGYISERSFIYILQDLITCPDELLDISPLPASWYKLKPSHTVELVLELFGDISYIDWREFLIHAMEMKMPTQDELLDAKEAFIEIDHNSTGIIYREQFILQSLWFPTSPELLSLRSLLHDNFEKDEYEMFEEEFDTKNWRTKFSADGKSQKLKKSISFWINSLKDYNSESDINSHDELLRMTLIKELLCEMYLNSYYTVNYIAMLLAFCKDDDPIYGFGKALSVALGKRVCVNVAEGEQYVNELLEKKRLSAAVKIQLMYHTRDAIEFTEEILTELMNKAIELGDIGKFSSTPIGNTFRELDPILIEKLDQPGETIDPASLLNAETPLSINSYDEDTNINVINDELDESLLSFEPTEMINKSIERKIVYSISIDVCESVLSALLPYNTIQYHISNTRLSFIDNLKRVYRDVECKDLDSTTDTALAYRIVRHPFILQLLQCTSKFTIKNLAVITKQILKNKQNDE